ncbi:MAG: hypothetical protein V4480_01720 [Patescibacteria group bacterium]
MTTHIRHQLGAFLAATLLISSIFAYQPLTAHAQTGGGGNVISDSAAQAAGSAAVCGLSALIGGGAAVGGAAGGTAVDAAGVASGFPVHDAALGLIETANLAANTTVAANTSYQNTIKCSLDAIAWSVAKVAVQSITRSTVNWINSGFQGSPAFVSDLKANLQNLGDAVADDFFTHLNTEVQKQTGFNLTSPFQDQINQQLRAEYYRTTGSWGLNYTLGQQSQDPKAFVQGGDFSKGGFNAFFSATQNPANNPFGAYKLASNQLWAQIDQAAQQRKDEIGWGKGFLPWRGDCPASTGNSKTDAISLKLTEKCPFNSIKTPGSVIESQLEGALGSGIRQLELADSINEIVGALVGQLVNQVLGSGGLSGVSQPSAGGGASYLSQATNGSDYTTLNTSLSDGILQQLTLDRQNIVVYEADWEKIQSATQAAQQKCGVRPEIAAASDRASKAISKATQALASIDKISSEIQATKTSLSANNSTAISAITIEYNGYLKTSPNDADEQEAASESSASSDSLYGQMVDLQKSCATSGG